MARTSASLFNMTTGHSSTNTEPHNADFCPPVPNAYFDRLDSSVPYIVNGAFSVPLAILTTFANLLVLLAMRHVTSIRLPSKLLLCSLLLTDLGAGLLIQPQYTVLLFMKSNRGSPYSVQCVITKTYRFTGSLFSGVSLLTMVAISLDRYTALFFHLKYQQIVTTRRVCAVLTYIWLSSLLFASAFLWNIVLWMYLTTTGLVIWLLVISVAYIKIYRRLRGQHGHQVQPQAHDQAQQQAGNTLNMAKYKRTASAMMWVYVLFVICYLPSLCAVLIMRAIGRTAPTVCIWEFSYTVLLLNSCLNPFLYCLRLPEIRNEVIKQLTRRFCCRSPQQ